MKYVLICKDIGRDRYYSGSYQCKGELYATFVCIDDVRLKTWKTRKGAEKALKRVQQLYSNDYDFSIVEIE